METPLSSLASPPPAAIELLCRILLFFLLVGGEILLAAAAMTQPASRNSLLSYDITEKLPSSGRASE